MSGATYRIDTYWSESRDFARAWSAAVIRLSDDALIEPVVFAQTEDEVVYMARDVIADLQNKPEGHKFYVFDDGTDAPAPDQHSVKA